MNQILSDYGNINWKREFFKLEKLNKDLDFSFLKAIERNFFFNNLEDVILKMVSLKEKEKELSKKESINFNVLNFFSIGETLHSKLLGFFLTTNDTHGQGDLFLRKFLEKLSFTDYEKGKWNVTIESERIDILIWRDDPHSVVIIENKSNNAVDQENQIYRYWHKAIYGKNTKNIERSSNSDVYKIVYLVSNDGKRPTENTLEKPKNWIEDENLPYKIPDDLNPIIWQFNKEIREILEDSLIELERDNYKLRSYIEQYIEFWK